MKRAPRSRRRYPGKDQSQRVGQLPFEPFHERMEWARRTDEKPLRPRPQPVRIEFGIRRGRIGKSVRGRGRHRDRRLDRQSVQHLRHRRDQTDGRPRQPLRESSPSRQPRTPPARWPAPWPTRRRCSLSLPDGRAGPATPATKKRELHLLPRRQGAERRPFGVVRKMFGTNEHVANVMEEAIAAMKKLGAEVIDPIQVESHGKVDTSEFRCCCMNSRPVSIPISPRWGLPGIAGLSQTSSRSTRPTEAAKCRTSARTSSIKRRQRDRSRRRNTLRH